MFRALAARALYLSLDRPDTLFAAKELWHDFEAPNKHIVVKLKRVVRYCGATAGCMDICIGRAESCRRGILRVFGRGR